MLGDGPSWPTDLEIMRDDPATTRPAGLCLGRGHFVQYGNAAFLAAFGSRSVGLPAREALVDLPADAFALMDAVFVRGRPLARWLRVGPEEWRLTVAPRRDAGTQEVYGIAFHLRARSDEPVLAEAHPRESAAS